MNSHSESPRSWKTNSNLWPKLKTEARRMRHSPTSAEDKLWQALRGEKTGYKFRRQHSIGPYIMDFYCTEARLAIEIDGAIHLKQIEQDHERQRFIENNRIKVLRSRNEDVLNNLNSTVKQIKITAQSNLTLLSLSPEDTGSEHTSRGERSTGEINA